MDISECAAVMDIGANAGSSPRAIADDASAGLKAIAMSISPSPSSCRSTA